MKFSIHQHQTRRHNITINNIKRKLSRSPEEFSKNLHKPPDFSAGVQILICKLIACCEHKLFSGFRGSFFRGRDCSEWLPWIQLLIRDHQASSRVGEFYLGAYVIPGLLNTLLVGVGNFLDSEETDRRSDCYHNWDIRYSKEALVLQIFYWMELRRTCFIDSLCSEDTLNACPTFVHGCYIRLGIFYDSYQTAQLCNDFVFDSVFPHSYKQFSNKDKMSLTTSGME